MLPDCDDNCAPGACPVYPCGELSERQERSVTLSTALLDVTDERARQDAHWGEQNHPLPWWLCILGEEYGELCQAVLEGVVFDNGRRHEFPVAAIRREAVQVAAVALAIVECIDRAATIGEP